VYINFEDYQGLGIQKNLYLAHPQPKLRSATMKSTLMMNRAMPFIQAIYLAIGACGIAFSLMSSPAHAQSELSIMIDRCSRGDMTACNIGNQLAIRRRQQQIYNNMPPAGNGVYVPCVAPSVCGSVGGNALPGDWRWTHQLYKDIRKNYPQAWYPSFPNSYRTW
jgi:hypothetical protein